MKRLSMIKSLALVPLLIISCAQDKSIPLHTTPHKITDYLYEIEFTDYKWDTAYNAINTIDNTMMGGACTVVRNGEIAGRNLDTPYCEMCACLIRVPSSEGRFASIGMSSYMVDITPSVLEKHPQSKLVDLAVFTMTDGINENGVFCAMNTLPAGDLPWKDGVNTDDEPLNFTFAVRYILDNAKSAEHACELLSHRRLQFSSMMREMHLMIADMKDTFIVEMLSGEMVIIRPQDNIMTNFYQALDHYTPHACGIERYELAKQNYELCNTTEGMRHLLYLTRYSNMYDRNIQPFWYSEYYLDYSMYPFERDININTPTEEYEDIIDKSIENYKHRKRAVLDNTWFSSHTSIYNIKEKTLQVNVQENYDTVYSFAL